MEHPDTPMCRAALDLAWDHSPRFLFNHVMRTFAFAREAGSSQRASYDPEMLFLGSVLHDLGLLDAFVRDERFEIDGADAAADFLSRHGYPDRKIAVVWEAIALHTTPGVPQRRQFEVALLQLGAGIDIGAIPRSLVTPEAVEIILAEFPRLGFKQAFLAAMGAVIRRKPSVGAMNLMGEVGREREHLPIPGFCDLVLHAEFDE